MGMVVELGHLKSLSTFEQHLVPAFYYKSNEEVFMLLGLCLGATYLQGKISLRGASYKKHYKIVA